ncbi:hypothetical protein MJH12_09700 [bacterium]|nr:hypothetical protein [bacterium]
MLLSSNFALSSDVEFEQVMSSVVMDTMEAKPNEKDQIYKAFQILKKAGVIKDTFKRLKQVGNSSSDQNTSDDYKKH